MAALLCSCSGGSGLAGDSGEDTAPDHAEANETIEAVETIDSVDSIDISSEEIDIIPDPLQDEEEEGIDPCLAQDAMAEGPCAMILDGVKWDGEHCVGLGSGCSCAGSDCESIYETIEECVEARRMCYSAACDPQPVADDMCLDCTDTYHLGAYWNGRECFELRGCGCTGDGCTEGFYSTTECEAVHANCDAALCKETGGQWFPAAAGFCGFFCGVPSDDDCEEDSCNCGPGRTFAAGVGCQDDPSCTIEHLCLATRGRWHPASECFCGFTCGLPNPCAACLDSCDCGPHRNFDPAFGCIPDIMCESATAEGICISTGGTWHTNSEFPLSCGDYLCGLPNTTDPCVMPGCDCGFLSNFDSLQGCIYDESCLLRNVRHECWGSAGNSSCRPGLACCDYCGVPPGCPACHDPCCPDSPVCMENGCMIPPP